MNKEERDNQIIELYRSGLGSPTISKKLGISKSTVLSILKMRNILDKTRVNGFSFNKFIETNIGKLSKDDKNDWMEVYDYYLREGSFNKLQEYLGINKTIVFRLFKKFGFKSLPEEVFRKRGLQDSLETKKIKKESGYKVKREKSDLRIKLEKNTDVIKNLYLDKKWSASKVGEYLGVNQRSIREYVKELGIGRSYKEAMAVFSRNSCNYTNIDFFENIDTEEKAYWLGFIYADGNVDKNKTLLTIGLKDVDENHLLKFSKIFGKRLEKRELKKYKNIKSNRVVVYCRIGNKYLCETLTGKGVEPRKTYKDSIEILNHIPDYLLRHFIRGLFDGDGCVHINKHKNCDTFCSRVTYLSNKSLIDKIKSIFREELDLNNVRVYNKKYYSSIQYGSDKDIRRLYNYMYDDANVYLERKRDIFDSYFKYRDNL
jgi:hypothetical protein